MLHGVSQAYPLRAVLGARTLMEGCRGHMSVSGWPKKQEDSRVWGVEVKARESRGSCSSDLVGLNSEVSHVVLEVERPTSNSGYSWHRTVRHEGPHAEGQGG